MMVYNGQLTPDEAARIATDVGPQVKTVDEVAAKATELLCPMCGGHLTVDDEKHQIVCRFCGYHQPQPEQSKTPAHQEEALLMALLKRKGQPVIWHVAKRVVQCQQCGAEHTITADKLSERCRFCGSTQVIISDALRSFEQPEALIPFHVTPLDAMNAVEKQLNSVNERLLHPFTSPKVEQHLAEGVFLPFWIFNCTAQITRIMTVFKPNMMSEQSQSSTLDVLNDIPISGVKSPTPSLVQAIANYEMSAAVGYDPKWLAKIPARLYQIDFDKASFDAREIASQAMRRKYKSDERHESNTSRNNQQTISIHQLSQIQSMTFHLMLLPLWIVLLGDKRIALVNGQTGKAAIGTM